MKLGKPFAIAALLLASSFVSAKTLEVEVNGLVCAFCAQGIEKTLRRFPAIDEVFVSLEHRLVAIAVKEGEAIDEAGLRQAITEAGYTTVSIKVTDNTLAALRSSIHNRTQNDD